MTTCDLTRRNLLRSAAACLMLCGGTFSAGFAEAQHEPVRESVRRAWELGLPLVEGAARRYPEQRKCFACHHQTLPMMAWRHAAQAGRVEPKQQTDEVLAFTRRSFAARKSNLLSGSGIGGQAATVAYGLWTYDLADAPPDDVSQAMAAYLLQTQKPDGRWGFQTHRPPMEASFVAMTALASASLPRHVAPAQREAAQAAVAKADRWLASAVREQHEDRVFMLWTLRLRPAPNLTADVLEQELWNSQRDDGGWGQLDSLPSDPYATGQALWALAYPSSTSAVGSVPADSVQNDPRWRQGVQWLVDRQEADGSWRLASRSKPIQTYFDNGDPHGRDQFISTPASCWALIALSLALEAP